MAMICEGHGVADEALQVTDYTPSLKTHRGDQFQRSSQSTSHGGACIPRTVARSLGQVFVWHPPEVIISEWQADAVIRTKPSYARPL